MRTLGGIIVNNVVRGLCGATDSPCRAGNPSCSLDSSAEDDELHAVDDGVASNIADERLHETLECLHVL